MTFKPTDWRTWNRLDDHPIFGQEKSLIAKWSNDPSQYCELNTYSRFMPEWYIHVDPQPPVAVQRAIATRDITNLADACKSIVERYGNSAHEIVVLDDFTVFVWLKNNRFSITIYPLQLDEEYKLMLFAESPVKINELRCKDVNDLVDSIVQRIG